MNMLRISICMVCFLIALGCNEQQELAGNPLVLPGAAVEKLADGFTYTEGPAVDSSGNVFFVDLPENRIYKWSDEEHNLSVFRQDSLGVIALYFDQHDNLYACQRDTGRIMAIAPDGQETTMAADYQGKPFYMANDLWVTPQGGVYFTHRDDPLPPQEEYGGHVFYVSPEDHRIVRVADDYKKPNGIIGSADGSLLYVSDRETKQTFRYRILPDGTLSEKQLFAAIGSDGMTLDENGNLYVTTDAVRVYNPSGEEIAVIPTPERPSNLTFGGRKRTTLFITAHTGLYAIPMAVAGMSEAGVSKAEVPEPRPH